MKKITLFLTVALAFMLAACPSGTEDSGGNQKEEKIYPVSIPQSGAYLNNTIMIMEPLDENADVYYTLDGTDPDPDAGSTRYTIANQPKMVFRNDDTVVTEQITLKAAALNEDGELSEVVTAVYTLLETGIGMVTDKMVALASQWKNMPGGDSADSPLSITLGADVRLDDVKIAMPMVTSPSNTVTDGLGGLFIAMAASGKYFALDLSNVKWEKEDGTFEIPPCQQTIVSLRHGQDRLVSVRFPLALTSVEPNAFRSTSGLRKADFSGCSKLTRIDEYSFASCRNLEELNLTGCTSMVSIEQYAFNATPSLRALDLADTILTKIGNNAFSNPTQMKYIEFPATLRMSGDYSFQYAVNLDYVRYRSTDFRPHFAWAQWLYFNSTSGSSSYPGNHRAQWPENAEQTATGKSIVIFTPDVPYWTSGENNGFYTNTGASYHIGQHVALPDSLDSLRGDALMNAQEPYRGLPQVTLNFSGDNQLGTASGTIVASYKDANGNAVELATGSITSGTGSITIGTPTGNLATLDYNTGQALTARYDRTGLDKTIRWNKNFGAYPGRNINFDEWSTTVNGWRLYHGEPCPYPRDTQFAILDLEVRDASNAVIGYPRRQAESTWWRGRDWNTEANTGVKVWDRRTVRYVYVNQFTTIYRRNKDAGDTTTSTPGNGSCNVFITLKPGWNLWEVMEWWQDYKTDADLVGRDDKQHLIANLISHGKIPYQDVNKENDDTGYEPNPKAANLLIWKPINWKLEAEPFKYPD